MSDEVAWVLEMNVKPGELDNWTALMREMVGATKANEPGTLAYQWFIDGSTCHLYERYVDSDAVMVHLGAFGEHFAERFLAAADPSSFLVYGDPSAAVREALAGMGPRYLATLGGFAR